MNTPQQLLEYYKYGITVFVNNYPVDLWKRRLGVAGLEGLCLRPYRRMGRVWKEQQQLDSV